MSRQIIFDKEVRTKITNGVQTLAKAVKVTLGPKGRNVMIGRKYGVPHVTKDGVTVAKEVIIKDLLENMGAQMVKDVASKTADKAGDGTTTATVLAEAIYMKGLDSLNKGLNPIIVKRGIDKAVAKAIEGLDKIKIPVTTDEQLKQIATVSANWDEEIGELIANAILKVGRDGNITVEESKTYTTSLSVVEGMQVERGYLSPHFATNTDTQEAVLENPYILLYDKKVAGMKDLISILNQVIKSKRPLLFVAEDVEGEALSTLVINKMRDVLQVCAIKAPGYGDRRKDMMEDIAILTGGRYIAEEIGLRLETTTLEHLGSAKKVIVTKDSTTIIEGAGNSTKILYRAEGIKNQIPNATSDYDKLTLEKRVAKLTGGVGVISVGGASEAEVKEKKDRIDDALAATKAALEDGIVGGGGSAFLQILDYVKSEAYASNESESAGVKIVVDAIQQPIIAICTNAGIDGKRIVSTILAKHANDFNRSMTFTYDKPFEYNIGFNIITEDYCSMVNAGVIDPVKVTKTALLNAASVAGLLLTTECMIIDDTEIKSIDMNQQ